MKLIGKIVILSIALIGFQAQLWAQGADCGSSTPFCTNLLDPYAAGFDGSGPGGGPQAPAGNNYDCLGTTGNPNWFNITIGEPGDLRFTLDNSNDLDIDFILWGPFNDLNAANAACGDLGNGGVGGLVADCSYSFVSAEEVEVVGVQPGEVYILMVTNYENEATDIFATVDPTSVNLNCDCEVTNTFSELPFPLNEGIMTDTSGQNAEFVVCGPPTSSPLGFSLNLKAPSSVDTLEFLSSTVGATFTNNIVFVNPLAVTDSLEVIIQVTPDATNIGTNTFVINAINKTDSSQCVESYNVTVIVPGVEVTSSDTTVCPGIEHTVQLTANVSTTSSAAGTGTFQWTQISGPTSTPFSDEFIENPTVDLPATIADGDSYVYQIEYTDNTGCTVSDQFTIDVANLTIPLSMTVDSNFLCNNGTAQTINFTTVITDSTGIGTQPGIYDWVAGSGLASTSIADPSATITGTSAADSVQYIVNYNYGTCTGADTTMVYFRDATLDVPATFDVCAGDTVDLYATLSDTFLFDCSNYDVESIAFAPVAGSGTGVVLGDDQVSNAFPIGFDFNFYCNDFTEFYISSNGYVTFQPQAFTGFGDPIPSIFDPNDLIALAFADLDPSAGGTIDYFTTGAAPNRQLVVNFTNVPHFASSETVTLQMVLHESTNWVDIHNIDVQSDGGSMTQGVENSDGTVGTAVTGRNFEIFTSSNESFRFRPRVSVITYDWAPAAYLNDSTLYNPFAIPADTILYTVNVTDGGCTLTETVLVNAAATLDAPIIDCSDSTASEITFSWLSVVGAVDGYEYSIDGGASWTTTADTFTVVTGLAEGTTINILVRGLDNGATCPSGLIGVGSCTTVICNFAAPVIACGEASSSFVTFTWDVLADATQGYEYSTDGGATFTATTDTFVVISGLGVDETVNILVRGLGDNPCPTGDLGSGSCASDACGLEANLISTTDVVTCPPVSNGSAVIGIAAGVAPYTYDLGLGDGPQSDSVFTSLDAGSYSVIVADAIAGCLDTVDFVIADNHVDVVGNIVQTATIPCTGGDVAAIEVLVSAGVAPYTYVWSDGTTTSTLENLGAGTYTVTITDATLTCFDTVEYTVVAPLNPTLDAYISAAQVDSFSVFIGDEINIDAGANEAGVTYVWSPSTDVDDANAAATFITASQEGTFTYTITAVSDSCSNSDQVILTVLNTSFLGMANAFTPNNDGVNDQFRPVELIGATVQTFRIYNRWGEVMYDNPNYESDGGWDGTKGGQNQPRDVYIYVLEYSFPGDAEVTQLRGEFSLIR